MKILIVTQYFWPESFRINDLGLQLKARGHDITVLTGTPNYPAGKFFEGYGLLKNRRQDFQGTEVIRCPLVPRRSGKGRQLILNYFSFAFFAAVLGPLYCRKRFDVIFVFAPSPVTVGLPAIVLKWLKRIPIVFWVQDLWPESLSATGAVRSPMILRQVAKLVRFIYSQSDVILAQSRAFIPEITKFNLTRSKVMYYPNSAENFYRPISTPSDAPERKQMPEGFKIMFAGNIGVAQDFETILSAAEILRDQKDIQWIILGEGRLRKWVEAEISKRGLQSTFHLLGQHPVTTMPTYFGLADALLVSLRKDPIFALTIPSKIQSYLACGKPILAALDGEGARIVEEARAGITCPAGAPDALAQAALRLYRMTPEERGKMNESALLYFKENFETEMLVTRLEAEFETLLRFYRGKTECPQQS